MLSMGQKYSSFVPQELLREESLTKTLLEAKVVERSRSHYVVGGVVVEKLCTRVGARKSNFKPNGHSCKPFGLVPTLSILPFCPSQVTEIAQRRIFGMVAGVHHCKAPTLHPHCR